MIESALFNVREGEEDHIDEIHDYGDENQQLTQDSDVWNETVLYTWIFPSRIYDQNKTA